MQIDRDKQQNIIMKFTLKELLVILIKRKLIFPRNFITDLATIFFKTEVNFQEEDRKNVD